MTLNMTIKCDRQLNHTYANDTKHNDTQHGNKNTPPTRVKHLSGAPLYGSAPSLTHKH
jgi:hypothetical protein